MIIIINLFKLFHRKNMLTTPPPPPVSSLLNVESVKIVCNCSDGCLVHLAGLKLKKSILKLGKKGFVPQLLCVIVATTSFDS